jgi:hypothetical protein
MSEPFPNIDAAFAAIEREAIDNFIRDELPGLLGEQLQVMYWAFVRGDRGDYDSDARFIASAIEQLRAEEREP